MDGAVALQSEPVMDGKVQHVQEKTEEQCDGDLQARAGLFVHQMSQYLN